VKVTKLIHWPAVRNYFTIHVMVQ